MPSFFFNDPATPEIYPLPLHDALPICLAKTGLFPSRVEDFYEFDAPEFLDLAVSLNTRAQAEDLTPDILRQVVQPMVDALVRAELYLVFAATLDVLRYDLRQKEEAAKIHLPGRA